MIKQGKYREPVVGHQLTQVSVSPYYLALAGTICVGVGAQVLLKIGAEGADSVAAQFSQRSATTYNRAEAK